MNLTIYPNSPDGAGSAFSPKAVEHIWTSLLGRFLKEDNVKFSQLEDLSVEFEGVPTLTSRIVGNTIFIADGHLRAATLLAYTHVQTVSNPRAEGLFNCWLDYLIDALVANDPAVHIDDQFGSFLGAVKAPPGIISPAPSLALFQELMFGFCEIVLLHEVGHLVLGHTTRRLPLTKKGKCRMLREFEFEADRFCVEYLQKLGRFSWDTMCIWFMWQYASDLTLWGLSGGLPESQRTHPTFLERIEGVLNELEKYEDLPLDQIRIALDGYSSLWESQSCLILEGPLRPVVKMSGLPPVDNDLHRQRALLRASQLKLLRNRQ